MLSILIPIYNQDVRQLVVSLAEQCKKCGINYQILCFDDASKPRYRKRNRSVETIFGVSYLEFGKNMGRSRIRNKLGFNAMYDNMIFLDCDSQIVSKKYIKKFINALEDHSVIYGGTIYSKRKPRSRKKQLHWMYGMLRERLPMDKRQTQPYLSFRSNNFLIRRNVFLKHPFDESIEGYGHEDTLFAKRLEKENIPIHHIDNPVQHGGLEPTEEFLSKVRESLSNLVRLEHEGQPIETNLSQAYEKLGKWRLLPLLRLTWKISKRFINRCLFSARPSIYCLDIYKLIHYDDLKRTGPK